MLHARGVARGACRGVSRSTLFSANSQPLRVSQAKRHAHRHVRRAAPHFDASGDTLGDTHDEERLDDCTPDEKKLLNNVAIVLCNSQGPANVGAVARVCQNFGLSDLRLSDPKSMIFAEDSEAPVGGAKRALSAECIEYAVSAGWLLEAAPIHSKTVEAIADCTFVLSTTARYRQTGIPVMDSREAAERILEEAARGKVAILFGNERTGLTTEDMALAHASVYIPTAAAANKPKTGAGGRFSLNLSHAAAILAYDLFQAVKRPGAAAARAAEAVQVKRQLLDTAGRAQLVSELADAVKALSIMRVEDDIQRLDDDQEMANLSRVLSAAPLLSKDTATLFRLARRISAFPGLRAQAGLGAGGVVDDLVLLAARRGLEEGEAKGAFSADAAGADGAGGEGSGREGGSAGRDVVVNDPKKVAEFLRVWLREQAGLSLTKREADRVAAELLGGREHGALPAAAATSSSGAAGATLAGQ